MRTIERWNNKILPKVINCLTPRLQEVWPIITLNKPLEELKAGIYFHGQIGSGKTVLAIQYLLKIYQQHYMAGLDFSYKFISVPNLLFEIKDCYKKDYVGETEKELLDRYSDYDLLILDDFAVEKSSDWSYQILYLIINNRYEGLKQTFFTSNLNLNQLAERFGDDRITSRISSMCKIIKLTSKDRRPKAN